ncbi:SURF1 family protein [Nocardia sp. CNY236]|uniref:SURF1 family cytochrome oxidase biogenesis protein n=1 Tax=Nocardia sp. CNY236 TaxID=1169152 RepID=UPI00040BCF51|nr:SURF1 family protein [Nocardia sp. CNY236]
MRKLTFLLRPSWVILAVVVVAFAYLCFTVLAPWQLDKNSATVHRNQLITDSMRTDPVEVTTVLSGTGEDTEWRRVVASGSYVPDSTVLVRFRHLEKAPGYAVLAAFALEDGRLLLIDRGLVAAVDGSRPPEIPQPPSGSQRIEALVRKSEGVAPGKDPSVQDGYRQVYFIDVAQESVVLGAPLTPVPTGERGGYLQLRDNQPGALSPPPLPQLDTGPYLSYGLQWLAFGIMAPLGLGYFVYAEIRQRKKRKVAVSSPPDTASAEVDASTAKPSNNAPSTTADRLADRYGRR